MASRPIWKGFIRFSLVSIPARAYTAAKSSTGRVALNQLHKDCGARIKYQKVCPVHGEVAGEQIVSGYQFAEDQYVLIEQDELAKLRSQNEKSISIEHFLPEGVIDPRFYSGRSIYITPDAAVGRKPYALLHRLLQEQHRVALAKAVFNNREQLLLIRPMQSLLGGTFLMYQSELKPVAEFEPEVASADVNKKELDLARTLVDQLYVDQLDLSAYHDEYAQNLEKLIEAKVAGQEVIAPPSEEEPQVINLMEALQKSVDAARAKMRPAKIASPASAQKRSSSARKRKSS